jgi:hypothetical protein
MDGVFDEAREVDDVDAVDCVDFCRPRLPGGLAWD